MKFRKDFVTNSSSSSYVCDICGRSETGWDAGIDEFDMMECINGHVFCCDEGLDLPPKRELVTIILENHWNVGSVETEDGWTEVDIPEDELLEIDEKELFSKLCSEYGCYNVAEFMCPICQFIHYSESDMSEYLLKEYGISRDEVFAEVKKLNRRRRKLYEKEYIDYVCKKFDLDPTEIAEGWKGKFGTYSDFKEWLRS